MERKRWSDNLRNFLINATTKETKEDDQRRKKNIKSSGNKSVDEVFDDNRGKEGYIHIPNSKRISLTLPPTTVPPETRLRRRDSSRDRSQGGFRSRDPSLDRSSSTSRRSSRHWVDTANSVLNQRRIISAVSSRDIRTSMTSESSLAAPFISHARSSRDLVRGERRSVQPRYQFSVHKDDLSDNIDDSIGNFDAFSQFCAQYAQEDDQATSQEWLEDGTTPTNSETPKDNTSLDFNQIRTEKDVSFDDTGSKEFQQIADCSGPTSNKNQVPSLPPYQGICHLCREEKLAMQYSRKVSQQRRQTLVDHDAIKVALEEASISIKPETMNNQIEVCNSDGEESSESDDDVEDTKTGELPTDISDDPELSPEDQVTYNFEVVEPNNPLVLNTNLMKSSTTLTGSTENMLNDDHPASRLVELFKDDMDQLIHIVLHHIPPVIPLEGEADEKFKSSSTKDRLTDEEEIKQIETKMAFLRELVMAQGSYRQNLLKSLKTAITLNTTFLILSHLSDASYFD